MRIQSPGLACFVLLLMFGSFDAAAQASHDPPEGFTALFNGKDLEGWFGGETRDPDSITLKGEPQWAKYRNQMYKAELKHWRIENGELIGKGAGPDLVTWKSYGDFELRLQWKVSKDGESGISFRGYPGIKLWDSASEALKPRGADKGSGGLSDNKGQGQTPSAFADKPAGQWNRMVVRMVGPYLTVILNDKKVLDGVELENAYQPGSPIAFRGPIHLRTISGEVHFRHIYVRELSAEEANEMLVEIAGDDAGYTPLFNGKDFTGWVGTQGYEIINGGIRCKRGQHGGKMLTENQYRDFVVRLEIKLSPGGNNGLMIRAPQPNKPGLELQVLDNPHEMFSKLKPAQYHGSAYGITPARRGYLRPTGQWNYQEVYVKGDHIKVTLNGYLIMETKLKETAPKHPAASIKQGHFGFLGHWDPVTFRNIRIKALD